VSARTVIVTGASSGIGRATVEALKHAGFSVLATARSNQDLEALRSEGVEARTLDVANPAGVQGFCDSLSGLEIYGVVHNAGVGHFDAIEELSWDLWRRQFDVNLFGAMDLTRRLLPQVRAQRGRFVYLSSLAGLFSLPLMGSYSASKFALEAAVDALRVEVKRDGVRAVLIEPGPVATRFQETVRTLMREHLQSPDARYEESYQKAVALIDGAGRIGAARVADVVLRALSVRSPRARYRVPWGLGLLTALGRLSPAWARDRVMAASLGLNR
jgi:NAD(P)-dependent dehydrogenase (short-subunit alcohol dehydrogenase family)